MEQKKNKKEIIDTKSFIKKAKSKHKNRYDYSISDYINSEIKVKIRCKKHGIFEQRAINHAKGEGCPKCKGFTIAEKRTLTTEQFIEKAKKVHGDKYGYSLSNYLKANLKVKIICKDHGIFEQIPSGHLRGKGCNQCGNIKGSQKITLSKEEFINKAQQTHNNKYKYTNTDYINSHTKVKIICPTHGEFEQLPYDHIKEHGCMRCTSSVSKPEKEICEFLESLNINLKTSIGTVIKPQQLDIYLPDHNLAIEYNGLYYHNELRIPTNYHLNKTLKCNEKGIRLIHIFEDEWLYKQEIVKSRLKNILGLTENKIFARKCVIKEVNSKESKLFLDSNHLQGFTNSSVKLGLYYNMVAHLYL